MNIRWDLIDSYSEIYDRVTSLDGTSGWMKHFFFDNCEWPEDPDEDLCGVFIRNEGLDIGCFVYRLSDANTGFQTVGTYVERDYRHCGFGSLLWKQAIRGFEPEWIGVKTFTREGHLLVRHTKRAYPEVRVFHTLVA
jgi:hypothetical protein